ncbi:MAG: hypothetical protein KGJ23_13950 [Euryarchaeota archaeon]|nr:hypothetical protein [Euryarchaeota archaeon]MDE1837701.1 hypothetical protein [Euryarchaeota archaeon]MDE1881740.1 hypothetical protein [Euryarchaeota archaeon]MDE2045969.1 hypothetical protein [Thermoplasmata archaeon]
MSLDRKLPAYRAVETLLAGDAEGLQFTLNHVVDQARAAGAGLVTDIGLDRAVEGLRCPDREKALVRLAFFLWDGSYPIDQQDLDLLTRADRERFLAALATHLGLPWVAPKPPAPEWRKESEEFLARQRDSFKDLPDHLKGVGEGLTATGAAIIQQGFDPATRRLLTGDMMAALSRAGIDPKRPTNRAEANAMTAYCFGNGRLEDLRAKGKALGSREVRSLMADAAPRVAAWLRVREAAMRHGPEAWWAWVNAYAKLHCQGWARK